MLARPVLVAAQPAVLAQHHLGPCRIVHIARKQRASTDEQSIVRDVDVDRRLGVLEHEAGPVGIVFRGQLERLLEKSVGVDERAEGDSATAGVA